MVKKGSLDVGCGKYSFSLNGPPKPLPSSSTDGTNRNCVPAGRSNDSMGMHRDEARNTIIPQFCSRGDVKDQTFGKDSTYPKLDYRSLEYPDIMVNIEITRNKECNDKTTTFVPENGCRHFLSDVLLDGCNSFIGDSCLAVSDDRTHVTRLPFDRYVGRLVDILD